MKFDLTAIAKGNSCSQKIEKYQETEEIKLKS